MGNVKDGGYVWRRVIEYYFPWFDKDKLTKLYEGTILACDYNQIS